MSGKFLSAGGRKLYVRGVTYGTFAPRSGDAFPDDDVLDADFAAMANAGINSVRTYVVPSARVLDAAWQHGLFVMVGIPWEQHVAFLEERHRARSIERRVRETVAACAGHPAVLCYAVGNEIPAPIVRWHGARRIERFIERLYNAAKHEDPEGIVTYVNYPSTEYLRLPFVDVVTFNVYLEERERLDAYLARLQNIAGDRPLLMAEIGLDSRRHGFDRQAEVLEWQVRSAFASGCAGAFVFSWTDEWHRGGYDIDDWDFGLTTRDRTPKPALRAVARAFAEAPLRPHPTWPRISVAVCSHNGAATLPECLAGLAKVEYPDFEVIVVDDGSTDATASIAESAHVRVVSTENQGLSAARNVALGAATGEIVAYLDDDAIPDPHWLAYLAHAFETTSHVAIGGPNIPPPDGATADAVASAPGGPIHVLLSDQLAEHVPGCNLAFRKDALAALGGFDPQFRAAGDDVDICWRVQERGWTIGFSPAAAVLHRRRDTVRAYMRQQAGYGKAEALLERKWPEKYNVAGHPRWAGRIYGTGGIHALGRRWRVYYGTWGTSLFQRLYQPSPTTLASLPLMPEWLLVIAALAGLSALGTLWTPLLLALPLLVFAVGLLLVEASVGAQRALFPGGPLRRGARIRRRVVTALLHVVQPAARLSGRLSYGLSPWRRRGERRLALPRPRRLTIWSERWVGSADRLGLIEENLRARGIAIAAGGDFDRWDLEASGVLGSGRLRMAIEEHGGGRQLVRFRLTPRLSGFALALITVTALLAVTSLLDGARIAAAVCAVLCLLVMGRAIYECTAASGALLDGVRGHQRLAEDELDESLRERVRRAKARARVATALRE